MSPRQARALPATALPADGALLTAPWAPGGRSVLLHPEDRHPVVGDGGQLDMFADSEALDAAEAAAARQRHEDNAPILWDSPARGYFPRIAAFEVWRAEYGNSGCLRRSHGWHEGIGGVHATEPTPRCQPATLSADLRCEHFREGCSCVGDLLSLPACLGCDWEGQPHRSGNLAVEQAHDHAWPGWRDMPTVPGRPVVAGSTSAAAQAKLRAWAAAVNEVYPAGWLAGGGPIRTLRAPMGTRHVPGRSGYGGYDLAVPVPVPVPAPAVPAPAVPAPAVPAPAVPAPAVPAPAVPAPAVPAPAVPGPAVPGPAVPGPAVTPTVTPDITPVVGPNTGPVGAAAGVSRGRRR